MSTQTITRTAQRAHPAISLLGVLTLVYGAGYVGAIAFNRGAPVWYADLHKPDWALPMTLFVPLWTVLYAFLGIAAWLVYRSPAHGGLSGESELFADTSKPPTGAAQGVLAGRRTRALQLFALMLALLAVWPWLFFYWHALSAASAVMMGLLVVVAASFLAFSTVNRLAGLLLTPYFAWCVYALFLSIEVTKLSPQHLRI